VAGPEASLEPALGSHCTDELQVFLQNANSLPPFKIVLTLDEEKLEMVGKEGDTQDLELRDYSLI
jgi:hypothetical protein